MRRGSASARIGVERQTSPASSVGIHAEGGDPSTVAAETSSLLLAKTTSLLLLLLLLPIAAATSTPFAAATATATAVANGAIRGAKTAGVAATSPATPPARTGTSAGKQEAERVRKQVSTARGRRRYASARRGCGLGLGRMGGGSAGCELDAVRQRMWR